MQMQTLSEWQVVILDNGIFIVLAMITVVALVFPWKHWNSIIDGGDNA